MKTKLTLFIAVLAVTLFGMGCASSLKEGLVLHYSFDGNVKDASGHEYDALKRGLDFRPI